MKKTEMEEHHTAYHELVTQARSAERTGLYRMAMQLALSSWEHVDAIPGTRNSGDTILNSEGGLEK